MKRNLLLALLIITPLGFATKVYSGSGAWWFQRCAGGIVYEVFWLLFILAIRPRLPPIRVAIGVFTATAALEILQLWHPPPLEAFRSTFLGRAMIGTTFDWWDFPHYVIGCVAGVLLVRCSAPEGPGP